MIRGDREGGVDVQIDSGTESEASIVAKVTPHDHDWLAAGLEPLDALPHQCATHPVSLHPGLHSERSEQRHSTEYRVGALETNVAEHRMSDYPAPFLGDEREKQCFG